MRSQLSSLVTQVVRAAEQRRQPDSDATNARLTEVIEVLLTDHAVASDEGSGDRPAQPDRVEFLATVFELDELECALLVAAAAPDLDANLGIAFELLSDGAATGARYVTVGTALELCALGSASLEARQRLALTAPLRRHHLLEVIGDGPWLSRVLRVPDRVVSHLVGDDTPHAAVAEMLVRAESFAGRETSELARAIELGTRLAYVRSALGAPGASMAVAAFTSVGVRPLVVDLERRPADLEAAVAVVLATREAGLLRAGLVLLGADLAIAPASGDGVSRRPDRGVITALERSSVPVVAVGQRGWDASWSRDVPLSFDATRLPTEQRRAVWQHALPRADLSASAWRDLVTLRLDPREVSTTVRYATALSQVRGEPVSADLVRESARRLGSGLSGTVRPGRTGAVMSDLVLPDLPRRQIEQLIGWASHRDAVLAQGAVNGPGGKGAGLAALLSGGPGTGKTLAAHVVADSLGLDLYPVDLATVVDKYVGETEKNLERVFHEAESLNVVLFFDEADSLFGSRSEVRDSRDRYANLEVAYLLQRMEQFDGIVILATNLQANLDPAFARRLHFIIHFPDPDEPTRRILWREHLARLGHRDEADPIDVEAIARVVDLAGGHVRNIVMAAAYDAAAAEQPVGMALISDAIRREYGKIGRRAPGEVGDWPSTLP